MRIRISQLDERQILMSSLSKRSSNKLNISVPRKTPKMSTTSSSSGGVKIQVKKKREDPIVSMLLMLLTMRKYQRLERLWRLEGLQSKRTKSMMLSAMIWFANKKLKLKSSKLRIVKIKPQRKMSPR